MTISLAEETIAAEHAEVYLNLEPGTYACLTVTDTGNGLDDETIRRAFEPYFTTKEESKGTGMGLATVHGIVKSHSGAIQVFSKPGEGAQFKVWLPVAERSEAEEPERTVPFAFGEGQHVMVVDDEESILEITTRLFERLGYRTTAFKTSEAALESFQDDPSSYDVVLTDNTMPRTTGLKLAEEVLKIRPNTPIILATGLNDKAVRERAKEAGIAKVIGKPVSAVGLSEAIRDVLNGPPRDVPGPVSPRD